MSTTAIDFPANRSQLDPSLNPPPYTDIPLQNGDTFIASGSSYTWAQDATEAYGRWKNEDPGATSDARYVKKEDEGNTQVINGGGTLSINDNILLHGTGGNAEFAGAIQGKGAGPAYAFEVTDGTTNMGGLYRDSSGANLYLKNSAGDNPAAVSLRSDGSSTFAGVVTTNDRFVCNAGGNKSGAEDAFLMYKGDGSTTGIAFQAQGSAAFSSNVNSDSFFWSKNTDSANGGAYLYNYDGNSSRSDGAFYISPNTGQTNTVVMNYDGSATFAASVSVYHPSAGSSGIQAFGVYGANSNTASIFTDGSATFSGNVTAPNVTFNLEANDPNKYTTTTETYTEPQTYTGPLGNVITMDVEKTREVRTYIGAVMNVKEVIQGLVTRCDNRDAQIAALGARIAQLELPDTPDPEPEPSPEPPPTPVVPHNLIPDGWTQEQRMAAMSELLQEYQANRD